MASQLHDDSFRDTIATIDQKGKRAFIFPKKPSGPMYDRRKIVSISCWCFSSERRL